MDLFLLKLVATPTINPAGEARRTALARDRRRLVRRTQLSGLFAATYPAFVAFLTAFAHAQS